jgi:peptidoglycan/LPS O-acetylase OafA/YrhL
MSAPTPLKNSKSLQAEKYFPQLDGVRGIACALVLFSHFWPNGPVHDFLNWGYIGVRLFFTLSGFLITGILLDARRQSNSKENGQILRSFYARRVLRIFPLYYSVLFLRLWLGPAPAPGDTASLLTFTANWQFVAAGKLETAGHFWSLAVEEQFYIFWPWVILFVPHRFLSTVIAAVMVQAPVVRLWMALAKVSVIGITFNTPGCLDTLGAGALLAWARHQPDGSLLTRRLVKWASIALVPLVAVSFPGGHWRTHYLAIFGLGDVLWAALALLFIHRAAEGFPGVAGAILGSGPLAYFGRISYGVYVYHGFAHLVLPWFFRHFNVEDPPTGWGRSLALTIGSIAVAALSWRFFEAPINQWKRLFPYRTRTERQTV